MALRELRRAWHHNALDDRSVVLAELASNIALLEWRVGERSRESAADAIRAQIKKVGVHLRLAFMLADISKTNAVGELRRIYENLQIGVSEDKLTPLKIQILMQAGELEDAARDAMSYMETHPLAANIANAVARQILQMCIVGRRTLAAELHPRRR